MWAFSVKYVGFTTFIDLIDSAFGISPVKCAAQCNKWNYMRRTTLANTGCRASIAWKSNSLSEPNTFAWSVSTLWPYVMLMEHSDVCLRFLPRILCSFVWTHFEYTPNRFYIALVDLRWRKGNPKVHSICVVLSNYPIMCFIQSCRAIVEKHMFFILRYNIFIRIETVFCIDTIDDSKLPLHGNRQLFRDLYKP